MVRIDEARATSTRSSFYRPEIDGLRAVAVIAVLINHLDHQWLAGGFLGVDLFFVISGYVVTASLARREEVSWREMLAGFYTRRFRRLQPALLLMVLVTSILFAFFVSSADDQYAIAMRTGLASLFGASNFLLLKQGGNYFELNTQFNPFLHTWSLGVEEQFYLLWPLLVMLCGVGFKGGKRICALRLLICTVFLSIVSFVLFLKLSAGQASMASFYLMPARFWELSAGAIIFLLQVLFPARPSGLLRLAFSTIGGWVLFILILVGFLLSSDQAGQYKPLFVLATAGLLNCLQEKSQLRRLLSHPNMRAVGLASYSLYLWHWPLIVLLRWTLGMNLYTLPLLLIIIALLTRISYSIEVNFRFGDVGAYWQEQPLFLYPMATALTAILVGVIYKFSGSLVYLGSTSVSSQNFTVTRSIPGSTITTYNCFLDPEAPLEASRETGKCLAGDNPAIPTLFLEGDSIAHSLIPLLESLYESRNYNVSFFARGSCITPFVKPWAGNRHLLPRYQNCPQHAKIRERAVLEKIKRGDQLLLATTNAYVQSGESRKSYLEAVSQLATLLEAKGAGLILFSPFPSFPNRVAIKNPLSLCVKEWFRPDWALPPSCRPAEVDRRGSVEYNEIIKSLQYQLQNHHVNVRVFDPLPILCPPGKEKCSTHMDGQMMFYDGIHLTDAGARKLYPAFQSFLRSAYQSQLSPH